MDVNYVMERNETIIINIIEKYKLMVSKDEVLSFSSLILNFQETGFRLFASKALGDKKWKQISLFNFLQRKQKVLSVIEIESVFEDFQKFVNAYEQIRALKKALEIEEFF